MSEQLRDEPPTANGTALTCPSCGEPVPLNRFMTLREVAQTLSVSSAQAYALVRSGDLPAIQLGGRGQWRVEVTKLEEFIQRLYDEAATSLG